MVPFTSNLLSGSVPRKTHFEVDGYFYLTNYSSKITFYNLLSYVIFQTEKKHRFQFQIIETVTLKGWEAAKFGTISQF